MLLILLTLAAIALGYVLALVYWGALFLLRPVLDVFKIQRKSESVVPVATRPLEATSPPLSLPKLDHRRLLWQQLYLKEFPQSYWPQIETKYLETRLRSLPASSGKNLVYVIRAHPHLARRALLVRDADLLSQHVNELRRYRCTVMVSEHYGREVYELQRQRQALEEPGFAPKQQIITRRPNSGPQVPDVDLHTRLFSTELTPAWR
jgi:hypothetical protein